ANAAYREAAGEAPGDAAIQTSWGELFLEKYNYAEAMRSFQMALQIDPRWTPALIGAAGALADDNPPQAAASAKRALAVNPSLVEAHLCLAEQAADADEHDEARQGIAKALGVNPSSLEAHALSAGLAYIEDKPAEFDAAVTRALAISPKYGNVYRVAGEMTAHSYRFDEAVVLTRKGLELDPQDPQALADL